MIWIKAFSMINNYTMFRSKCILSFVKNCNLFSFEPSMRLTHKPSNKRVKARKVKKSLLTIHLMNAILLSRIHINIQVNTVQSRKEKDFKCIGTVPVCTCATCCDSCLTPRGEEIQILTRGSSQSAHHSQYIRLYR